MPSGSILQLVTVLILLVLVIVLAYAATKWIAGYQKLKGAGANLEVIETLRIAPQKFIAIVRIGNGYHAVGVGKDEVTYLSALDADDIAIHAAGEAGGMGFKEVLSKLRADRSHRGEE